MSLLKKTSCKKTEYYSIPHLPDPILKVRIPKEIPKDLKMELTLTLKGVSRAALATLTAKNL